MITNVSANALAPDMFIGGVFFDDGALLGIHQMSGTGTVAFEFANGKRLDNPVFNFLETVVIFVQHSFGFLQVEIID